jgi:phage terminase small subunit
MIDLDPTKAAIRTGYSVKTATSQASRLLSNVNIQNYIAVLRKEAKENLGTTHGQMLAELRNFAYSDITQTMCLTLDQIKELPDDITRMVTGYKSKTRLLKSVNDKDGTTIQMIEETFELKFYSKEKAMEQILKHTGFYDVDNREKNQVVVVIPPKRE